MLEHALHFQSFVHRDLEAVLAQDFQHFSVREFVLLQKRLHNRLHFVRMLVQRPLYLFLQLLPHILHPLVGETKLLYIRVELRNGRPKETQYSKLSELTASVLKIGSCTRPELSHE